MNSPETPTYNKSNILFGLEATRDFIRKERSIVILEGYTDFLQLFQQGITNLVATSGTALTDGHVNQIRRFADSAHLAYDGDDAYFVVAADKGTASMSDVANAVAIERGFWLGDAFASGGNGSNYVSQKSFLILRCFLHINNTLFSKRNQYLVLW
jgi:hypothetical protein